MSKRQHPINLNKQKTTIKYSPTKNNTENGKGKNR